jgi:hypothetical protein
LSGGAQVGPTAARPRMSRRATPVHARVVLVADDGATPLAHTRRSACPLR